MQLKQEKHSFYDLHIHILPGMDDGAKDLQMSIAMLQEEARQGCKGIVATPHYYPNEPVTDFLRRREKVFCELNGWITENMPDWKGRIALGAEVAYYNGLSYSPYLDDLCMGHSMYLLLEMPFEPWTSTMFRDISSLIARGIQPIIAHLERYPKYVKKESIQALLQTDVLIQMNAGALLHRSSARQAIQMVQDGVTQVIGSDAHNLDTRKPNIETSLNILQKKHLRKERKEIMDNNAEIFWAAMSS